MDFGLIVAQGTGYNLHTHTQFCDGHATMEEFVEAAIKAGYRHLGFTPHSPIPFNSSCNMEHGQVDAYFQEIARLRERYEDRLSIYAGMEIDYLNGWGPTHPYFASLPLDYTIGSVHFIPSFDDPDTYIDVDGKPENFILKMKEYFHDDIESVVRSFFNQYLKMVKEGGFDIVGHFDKIGRNASHYRPGIEDEPWYRKQVDKLADAIIAKRYAVEINTKMWETEKRFFPAQRLWQRLINAGLTIVVNSDAHVPALLDSGRPTALSALEDVENRFLDF